VKHTVVPEGLETPETIRVPPSWELEDNGGGHRFTGRREPSGAQYYVLRYKQVRLSCFR
jgi:hypothetical protein